MIRAGDIYTIAFGPRWEHRVKTINMKTGAMLQLTTLHDYKRRQSRRVFTDEWTTVKAGCTGATIKA